jgi:hypothetical protein
MGPIERDRNVILTDLDAAVCSSYAGEPIEVPITDHGIGLKAIRDAIVEYRLLGWTVEFLYREPTQPVPERDRRLRLS